MLHLLQQVWNDFIIMSRNRVLRTHDTYLKCPCDVAYV